MKKLLTVAMGAILLCGVAGCGPKYDKTVLAFAGDDAGKTFHVAGGWGGVDGVWAPKDETKMTATSVAEVAKLDKALAKKLSQKTNLKYLYVGEVDLSGECTWKAKALVNGEVKEFDANHTVKAIRAKYDEADKAYIVDQWVTDPHTAHAEALTDNLFIPTWQEAADEKGFEWSQNPVCTDEGNAKYTLVVAQYDAVSSPEVCGFGLGLVKKA